MLKYLKRKSPAHAKSYQQIYVNNHPSVGAGDFFGKDCIMNKMNNQSTDRLQEFEKEAFYRSFKTIEEKAKELRWKRQDLNETQALILTGLSYLCVKDTENAMTTSDIILNEPKVNRLSELNAEVYEWLSTYSDYWDDESTKIRVKTLDRRAEQINATEATHEEKIALMKFAIKEIIDHEADPCDMLEGLESILLESAYKAIDLDAIAELYLSSRA